MKCDELKEYKAYEFGTSYVYHILEVREAIAELKAELDKAIAERDGNQVCIDALKQKLEDVQASHYAEIVDAGMRERRLRRALYKACTNWAFLAQWERGDLVENWEKWENVERKCGAKAKEYGNA